MSYKSRIFRVICSLLILFVGTTMALALNDTTSLLGTLGKSLGLAFIVTGCISVFREGVISPAEFEEIKKLFGNICEGLLKERICLLSEKRIGHPTYHKWLLETKPQHIFFAGHSVLHRVQKDFKTMGFKSVEENIEQKLSEGSHINILFLDPTWEILKDMAKGEGQSLKAFSFDIKTTLEICHNIMERIKEKKLPGEIHICTCRETIQYAYHYVFCPDKDESEMLIGFYFAKKPGTLSPLFCVEGESIQQFFKKHFESITEPERGTTIPLLTYTHNGEEQDFKTEYYKRCLEVLNGNLSL